MSDQADHLDRLANQLMVEARGLAVVADAIEPIISRVRGAWEGPAADRLVSELGERRHEVNACAASVRSLARRKQEEARRIRAAEATALAAARPDSNSAAGGFSPR